MSSSARQQRPAGLTALTRLLLQLLAALLALGHLPAASARPSYFTLYVPGASCTSHPDRDLKGLGAPHGTPKKDVSISFTLRNATGAPVCKVCPGEQLTLKVSFPQARLALLTASQGSFASLPSSETQINTPRCPNRADLGRSMFPNKAFTVAFTVPCDATGDIQFRVTSATTPRKGRGRPGQWAQSELSVAVDSDDCSAAAGTGSSCGGGGPSMISPPPVPPSAPPLRPASPPAP